MIENQVGLNKIILFEGIYHKKNEGRGIFASPFPA